MEKVLYIPIPTGEKSCFDLGPFRELIPIPESITTEELLDPKGPVYFGPQIHCGCGHFNGWRDRYCKKCSLLREKSPHSQKNNPKEKYEDPYNNKIVNDIKFDWESGYILCRTCSRLKDRQRVCVTCNKICYSDFFMDKAYCEKCDKKTAIEIKHTTAFSDQMVEKISKQNETIDNPFCTIS